MAVRSHSDIYDTGWEAKYLKLFPTTYGAASALVAPVALMEENFHQVAEQISALNRAQDSNGLSDFRVKSGLT